MPILVINLCAQELHYFEFVRPIEDIISCAEYKFFTKHYSEIDKKDIEMSSKIIICGTSLKDFGYENYLEKFIFLHDYKRPVLGICAGMQIICRLLGCNLAEEKEIGTKTAFFEDFLGINGLKEIYCLHKMSVVEDDILKSEFNVKARTSCVQAIEHKYKPLYCTLFHPEVRNKQIIEEFLKEKIFRQ